MKKIIKLTEKDLHRIIENSVRRVIRETKNDDIENGAEAYDEDAIDTYADDHMVNDADHDDYLGFLNDKYQQEDDDMEDYINDREAEKWIGLDQHDPTDNELYNYW